MKIASEGNKDPSGWKMAFNAVDDPLCSTEVLNRMEIDDDIFKPEDKKTNPWNVKNLDSFQFYNCPECSYRNENRIDFRNHAIYKHPMVRNIFNHMTK